MLKRVFFAKALGRATSRAAFAGKTTRVLQTNPLNCLSPFLFTLFIGFHIIIKFTPLGKSGIHFAQFNQPAGLISLVIPHSGPFFWGDMLVLGYEAYSILIFGWSDIRNFVAAVDALYYYIYQTILIIFHSDHMLLVKRNIVVHKNL